MVLLVGGERVRAVVADMNARARELGREILVAEKALDAVSITCNKQILPDDPNPPLRPSGIRLGTPAATTRGFAPRAWSWLTP